ncbi:hypothetical protein GCM10022223_19760 [Kineosporia mesophila]|uniref:Fibronectin type-III domain-containing protein n=1 Tax=Kineosporia mesophila TaxID=566012 RepID=A0ABP6ZCB8_9ACTN|nr:hypothetical protein [Kineosporia mesophila]MCD5353339.1 hypothetical protein [Kineosporia mesophila]
MTSPLSGLRRQPILIALAAIVFVLLAPIQARAAFQVGATASSTWTTGILAAPSSPQLTTTCGTTVLVQATMTVSWTATTSAYATGYVVTPVLNSTAQTAVNVSSSATSVTVNVNRNGVSTTSSYAFRVQSSFRSWTSSAVTTSSANCPFLSV